MTQEGSLFEKGVSIVVAKVGAPFGLKGQLKLWSFTDPADNILAYDQFYLKRGSQPWQAIKALTITPHGDGFLIHFPGLNSREKASQYTNCLVGVGRHEFTHLSEDEYYWADLEGLEVVTTNNKVLGKVDHILPTGANDVIVVVQGKQKTLIPFIGQYVEKVDLEQAQIVVDWDFD